MNDLPLELKYQIFALIPIEYYPLIKGTCKQFQTITDTIIQDEMHPFYKDHIPYYKNLKLLLRNELLVKRIFSSRIKSKEFRYAARVIFDLKSVDLVKGLVSDDDVLLIAVMLGDVDFFEKNCSHKSLKKFKKRLIGIAVVWDRRDMIRFLIEKACSMKTATRIACILGNISCLKFLLWECGGVLDFTTMEGSACFGNKECLSLHLDLGLKMELKIAKVAAEYGHLECLKFVTENLNKSDIETYYDCAVSAVKNGNLECLKYAIKMGYPLSSEVCVVSASKGFFECLKFAVENGCEMNEEVCASAAEKGHFECLKYAHEQNCPWDGDCVKKALLCSHFDCFEYSYTNGAPIIHSFCKLAAYHGRLDFLIFAKKVNLPTWDASVTHNAAKGGHLDCLIFCIDNGCPWEENLSEVAARFGNLECLRYLYSIGASWDVSVTLAASSKGKIDCLKYAHEQNCPWDESVVKAAYKNGHQECYDYAIKKKCPGYENYEDKVLWKNFHLDKGENFTFSISFNI